MPKDVHVVDQLPAYALNILKAEEAAQVAKHLQHCQDCQAEWQSCQELVDSLGLAAIQKEPPAALKQKILQKVQPRPIVVGQTQPGFLKWWLGWLRRSAPVWGTISLALLLLLVVGNLVLWRQMSAPDTGRPVAFQTVLLEGTESFPAAKGLVVITTDGKNGTLIVEGLASLPADFQYQLWLIKDGTRTSGGVFSVEAEGYGVLEVHAPMSLTDYSGFGVTIEPAGGSPAPTGAKVLGGGF